MDLKTLSVIGVVALPAITALSWRVGWFLFNFKKIVKNMKDERILKKMTSSLGLVLKRSKGYQLIIVRQKEHDINSRALSTSANLLSESATELKNGFLKTERLSFFDENGEEISIKNIFFQKSDNEIEILADLAAR